MTHGYHEIRRACAIRAIIATRPKFRQSGSLL